MKFLSKPSEKGTTRAIARATIHLPSILSKLNMMSLIYCYTTNAFNLGFNKKMNDSKCLLKAFLMFCWTFNCSVISSITSFARARSGVLRVGGGLQNNHADLAYFLTRDDKVDV